MLMRWLPLLLLVLFPMAELFFLIYAGSRIGVLMTILLILLTAAYGFYLIRLQGLEALYQIRAQIASGKQPVREVAYGIMILLCGFMLILPGFISDFLALIILLFSHLRHFIAGQLMSGTFSRKRYKNDENKPDPFKSASSTKRKDTTRKGNVIDGEFHRLDDD